MSEEPSPAPGPRHRSDGDEPGAERTSPYTSDEHRAWRPPPGAVAELADRPVDPRRVARVMGLAALLLAAGCLAMLEQLLSSADVETDAVGLLRRAASAGPPPDAPPGRVAVVLIDGLRVDEARALPSWRRLAEDAARGTVALPTPTVSTAFYHLLLTGVPPDASGVRTNRYAGRARFDSVADRVREAGGEVQIVAEGLDWIRHLHGRPGDGGSDAPDALGAPLEAALERWRASERPSLLIVHQLGVDRAGHMNDPMAKRAALAEADRLIERLAGAPDATVLVLSDHGHIAGGGHGGPEPEVAFAPLLVTGPRVRPGRLETPIDAERLATTLAAHLGVSRPASAVGSPVEALIPTGAAVAADRWYARARHLTTAGRRAGQARLSARRRWTVPLALLLAVLTLGPIKRAFGFDRSVPVAIVAWPSLVLGLHLALGRPLSLSAIDEQTRHGARVALIGLAAAALAFAVARLLGRRRAGRQPGDPTRRAAATVGWTAWACALLSSAWVGFALGPWAPSPRTHYLPLLMLGAAAAALIACGATLLVGSGRLR